MGKGDKKTTKGKRFKGSYGVSRQKKNGKAVYVPKKTAKAKTEEAPKDATEAVEAPAKKAAAKKPAAKKAAPKKAAAKKAKK
ncbi:MAG: 30S ribosomal protein THX [Flavobacteriales bacterium]|nr:30S ribosomal protein THX [Flavobacteriales bacterium]